MVEYISHLKNIWNHLDDACGSLDNALIELGLISDLPKDIQNSMDFIDFSSLVILKNKIEDLIETDSKI